MPKYEPGDLIEWCGYGQADFPGARWSSGKVICQKVNSWGNTMVHVTRDGKNCIRKFPENVRPLYKMSIHGNELRLE